MSESTTRVTVSLRDKRAKHFYRAGHKFLAGETKTIEATEDVIERLKKEPKLMVKAINDDFDSTPTESPTETPTEVPTEAPTDAPESIFEAIGQLDPENPEHFTKSGKPEVKALEAILGCPVTAKERDSAWVFYQDGQTGAAD